MKKIQPEIKTIFATGYINPEERLEMLSQGAAVVIPSELLQEIRVVISGRATAVVKT